MNRALKLFSILLKTNFSADYIYRANLWTGITGTLLWMVLSIIGISVVTYQTPSIGGWVREELFLVQGVYSIILGLMYFLVSESLKKLSKSIYKGDLDLLLVKPLDTQLHVSLGNMKTYHLARVVGGFILLYYSLHVLGIKINLVDIGLFMVFILASCIVVYSIWFMLTTLNIWLINLFNMHELFIQVTGITRYPLEILRFLSNYLFYVMLPLVVVTTVPAKILLHRLDYELISWSLVLAVGLFYSARKFWLFALHYYTSASS